MLFSKVKIIAGLIIVLTACFFIMDQLSVESTKASSELVPQIAAYDSTNTMPGNKANIKAINYDYVGGENGYFAKYQPFDSTWNTDLTAKLNFAPDPVNAITDFDYYTLVVGGGGHITLIDDRTWLYPDKQSKYYDLSSKLSWGSGSTISAAQYIKTNNGSMDWLIAGYDGQKGKIARLEVIHNLNDIFSTSFSFNFYDLGTNLNFNSVPLLSLYADATNWNASCSPNSMNKLALFGGKNGKLVMLEYNQAFNNIQFSDLTDKLSQAGYGANDVTAIYEDQVNSCQVPVNPFLLGGTNGRVFRYQRRLANAKDPILSNRPMIDDFVDESSILGLGTENVTAINFHLVGGSSGSFKRWHYVLDAASPLVFKLEVYDMTSSLNVVGKKILALQNRDIWGQHSVNEMQVSVEGPQYKIISDVAPIITSVSDVTQRSENNIVTISGKNFSKFTTIYARYMGPEDRNNNTAFYPTSYEVRDKNTIVAAFDFSHRVPGEYVIKATDSLTLLDSEYNSRNFNIEYSTGQGNVLPNMATKDISSRLIGFSGQKINAIEAISKATGSQYPVTLIDNGILIGGTGGKLNLYVYNKDTVSDLTSDLNFGSEDIAAISSSLHPSEFNTSIYFLVGGAKGKLVYYRPAWLAWSPSKTDLTSKIPWVGQGKIDHIKLMSDGVYLIAGSDQTGQRQFVLSDLGNPSTASAEEVTQSLKFGTNKILSISPAGEGRARSLLIRGENGTLVSIYKWESPVNGNKYKINNMSAELNLYGLAGQNIVDIQCHGNLTKCAVFYDNGRAMDIDVYNGNITQEITDNLPSNTRVSAAIGKQMGDQSNEDEESIYTFNGDNLNYTINPYRYDGYSKPRTINLNNSRPSFHVSKTQLFYGYEFPAGIVSGKVDESRYPVLWMVGDNAQIAFLHFQPLKITSVEPIKTGTAGAYHFKIRGEGFSSIDDLKTRAYLQIENPANQAIPTVISDSFRFTKIVSANEMEVYFPSVDSSGNPIPTGNYALQLRNSESIYYYHTSYGSGQITPGLILWQKIISSDYAPDRYSIKYLNTSANTYTNLQITDAIPGDLKYVPNSTIINGDNVSDSGLGGRFTINNQVLTWNFPTISPNSQGEVTFGVDKHLWDRSSW